MDKGQTIMHRFDAGTLSGCISCEWTMEVQAAFFPRPGTMHPPQSADLKVSLANSGDDKSLGTSSLNSRIRPCRVSIGSQRTI